MKSSITPKGPLYAGFVLLGLSFLGILGSAVYGYGQAEYNFFANLLFYVGLVSGAIGFICICVILYYKFRQREDFGIDEKEF